MPTALQPGPVELLTPHCTCNQSNKKQQPFLKKKIMPHSTPTDKEVSAQRRAYHKMFHGRVRRHDVVLPVRHVQTVQDHRVRDREDQTNKPLAQESKEICE
jgi:hypothetical protein